MVYITPGLFGHNPTYSQYQFSAANRIHSYPDMVEPQLMAGPGKRKRSGEDITEGPSPKHISLCSTDLDRSGPGSLPLLSRSPTCEGLIRLHPAAHGSAEYRTFPRSSGPLNFERRPVKQMKRSTPKLCKTPSHLMDIEVDTPSSPPVQRAHIPATSDLRSCHACGTAPKRKRDLENYMDCRKCEQRTCYICARQCSGCQKDACKDCVVEVGEEGEPWCLTCYQHINL